MEEPETLIGLCSRLTWGGGIYELKISIPAGLGA